MHVDQGVSIFRRGRIWWLDTCTEGVRKQESLKTTNRDHAWTIAKERAAELASGQWNVALATATTFDRAVERFQKEYESKHHCEGTIKFTARVFRRVGRYLRLRHRGPVPLDRIRREDVEAYQGRRSTKRSYRGTRISPASVNREFRELSTLWGWIRSMGLTRKNPFEGVKALKVIRRLKRTLGSEECGLLVRELNDLLADIAIVIGGTGMRFGEASHLRAEDALVDEHKVQIKSRPDYQIKDREEREISNLPEPVLEVLRRRKIAAGPPEALLFPNKLGIPVSKRNALRDLKTAAKKAGLKNPKEVSWQMLRRSFATFNAAFMTTLALQSILGHSSPVTTAKGYVHGVDATPRALIQRG
jgi:integrase